jgi:RNA polymerase sigma factor (sigma-70 family)
MTRLARQYLSAIASGGRPNPGLESAWHEFYRACNAWIRGWILAQGLRGPDVDDCTQDVWSEVVCRLPALAQLDEHCRLRGWLFVVARSKVVNVHRRKLLRRSLPLEFSHDIMDSDADPALRLQWKLGHAALLHEIARLQSEVSETNAIVLQMRLIDGLSVSEVAHRLGFTPRQVWHRQRRMLTRLRSRLANRPANILA